VGIAIPTSSPPFALPLELLLVVRVLLQAATLTNSNATPAHAATILVRLRDIFYRPFT
jgi:hypothetical protein